MSSECVICLYQHPLSFPFDQKPFFEHFVDFIMGEVYQIKEMFWLLSLCALYDSGHWRCPRTMKRTACVCFSISSSGLPKGWKNSFKLQWRKWRTRGPCALRRSSDNHIFWWASKFCIVINNNKYKSNNLNVFCPMVSNRVLKSQRGSSCDRMLATSSSSSSCCSAPSSCREQQVSILHVRGYTKPVVVDNKGLVTLTEIFNFTLLPNFLLFQQWYSGQQ